MIMITNLTCVIAYLSGLVSALLVSEPQLSFIAISTRSHLPQGDETFDEPTDVSQQRTVVLRSRKTYRAVDKTKECVRMVLA